MSQCIHKFSVVVVVVTIVVVVWDVLLNTVLKMTALKLQA